MQKRAATPENESTVIAGGRSLADRAPALASILLGFLIIYGVGFAPIQAIHNAAHDSRHSAAFPCH